MLVLQRFRGLVGMAVVWGVAVSAIGTAFIVGGLAAWSHTFPPPDWTQWVTLAARVAAKDLVLGSASGVAFAMLLAGAERRRNVDSLSLSRVAGWGFLASAVPTAIAAILSGAIIPPMTFAAGTVAAGLLGVGLGVGMVRVARRSGGSLAAESTVSVG